MMDPCSLESNPLLSVQEALERMANTIDPVAGEEKIVLKNALGRVVSQPVYSPIDIPSDRNASMDGYALSSRDMDPEQPFRLRLTGSSWAGKPFQGELQKGECIRIFTGAVLPSSADSVVMQELAQADGETINFPANLKTHQYIREAGEDIKQESPLCAEAKKLTAIDLALLASAGIYELSVKRRIKIAYFSTGDELTAIGRPLTPGKIYDSNRYSLSGLLADPCYSVADMGIIADDKQLLEKCLIETSKHFDVIITTGGASVGDADYIKEILERIGQVNFWKLAIKPGKPLAFGKIGSCYFFGLPGNPVSVIVTFQQIVAPALKRLAGTTPEKPLRFKAVCTTPLKKEAGRQEFQRGILTQDENGDFFVASSGSQGSHILSSMSRSQCYIVLPADCKGIQPGETVIVEPFRTFI
jgi:molybdopterin molybdotransferase